MAERILVAVDGSSASTAALREAIRLARERQAALRIVHVVDNAYCCLRMADGLNVERIARAWCRAGQRILDQAAAEAKQAGVEPEAALLECREIGGGIIAEAKRWQASLIIMGTHGRRGIARLLLGSVSAVVAQTAPTPVQIMPAE